MLPGFLGIGALKAGTTYLDAMLRSHPDACMPKGKEIQFFSKNFDRGLDWYAGQFSGCGARVAGEISPQYLIYDGAAQRIKDALPDVRLFVSLRDPVHRLQSHYKHNVQHARYRGSFEEFANNPAVVRRSCYATLLRPYLDLFAAEQMLLVIFEQMVADPQRLLPQLYEHVGLAPDHVPAAKDEAVNVSALPRFHRLYKAANLGSRWLRDHGAHGAVEAGKSVSNVIFRPKASTEWSFDLSAEAQLHLLKTFQPEVEQLTELLDMDLGACWPTAVKISSMP